MASLQVPSNPLSQRTSNTLTAAAAAAAATKAKAKITKSRSRTVVKPLLKKLHTHSSDRESLDLDRGWDDQPSPRLASLGLDVDAHHHGAPASSMLARDVIFSLAVPGLGFAAGVGAGATSGPAGAASTPAAAAAIAAGAAAAGVAAGRVNNYSHARSTSGASHVSIATTNGGSFVHPFQQTPQPSTLPFSCANSRASLDNSPTITEDGDDFDPYSSYHSASASGARTPAHHLQHHHRRSSLAASSLSDATNTLRVTASRSHSHSGSAQHLASGSLHQSRSDLQLSVGASLAESPPGAAGNFLSSAKAAASAPSASPSVGPMSPLRNSLDMGSFRLRSRSDVDMATRQEQVREARRKFEAKERAKEEKYTREQNRKRERADSKEAQKLEREQARLRKGSHASLSSGTYSSGPHRRTGDGLDDTDEKDAFSSRGIDSFPLGPGSQPRVENVEFKSPRRARTAKHRTMSVWTTFMLWLRTRLLKLGRR